MTAIDGSWQGFEYFLKPPTEEKQRYHLLNLADGTVEEKTYEEVVTILKGVAA